MLARDRVHAIQRLDRRSGELRETGEPGALHVGIGVGQRSEHRALDLLPLGPELSLAELKPGAQLFIMARAAGVEGGPPIAVIRRPPSTLPGEFSLSDANVMLQGQSLGTYPAITVVARVSHSGQPSAQPGDWQAEAVVRPGSTETVALVIDQVVQ